MCLVFFASELKWFPVGGMVSGGNLTGTDRILSILYHMTLPAMVLILTRVNSNFLLMKSIVSEVKNEEYIITAFAKGLTNRQVIFRHAARNVMAPYLTSVCMQLGGIFGGAIFVEVVFSWKGLGILFSKAMNSNDYPILQFCFLITTVCVLVFYFISDIIVGILDPRIKGGENID